VTRQEFMEAAKGLAVSIDGNTVHAAPKVFSTESVGWHLNAKVDIDLPDGTTVHVQVGMNATVIGSRDWTD
jgi:hypothetical protein